MAGAARSLARAHPRRLDVPLLILASSALLAAGLALPLIHVEKLWTESSYSVATGVFGLWQDGHPVLASVVFFFSVIFPVAKLGMLLWIWFVPQPARRREFVLDALAGLGKWSMLDVYIVAILIVAVRLGPLAEAEPRAGVYFFGAAILASMVTTQVVRGIAQRTR